MNIIKTIEEKIRNSIDIIDIDVIDESIKHSGHYFTPSSLPSHIKIILISNNFIGMSFLKRHKLIYDLLKDEMKLIHAISLHFYTENEYIIKK
ncbi:BolA/IbaG family iron-sulfur metabolism protein [Wolbachia endosymbiont of Dipetalonema caudispina]|uniref:BolA family protein n=1 Tax=Wolbachia endosymbiont of Dipetalonema caudispina TaxID=1812112 RepID=UPI00158BA841|nr:BolA family protein [Wolbachia endosymbiont of Dipetalonema caudispina]QKX01097.1 BolA/IbaG family iron-sulfur metabolism protein [Wolbachia endosymbiont of Dipetalonema caudispina]